MYKSISKLKKIKLLGMYIRYIQKVGEKDFNRENFAKHPKLQELVGENYL